MHFTHFSQDADIQEEEKWKGLLECKYMYKATESVLAAKMSVREAAGRFNLPKSSLQDRISKIRKDSKVQVPPELERFERTFTVEYEEELANHVNNLDDTYSYASEFLKLGFSLDEELNIPHRLNREQDGWKALLL
jgi:hypothetical protein